MDCLINFASFSFDTSASFVLIGLYFAYSVPGDLLA